MSPEACHAVRQGLHFPQALASSTVPLLWNSKSLLNHQPFSCLHSYINPTVTVLMNNSEEQKSHKLTRKE